MPKTIIAHNFKLPHNNLQWPHRTCLAFTFRSNNWMLTPKLTIYFCPSSSNNIQPDCKKFSHLYLRVINIVCFEIQGSMTTLQCVQSHSNYNNTRHLKFQYHISFMLTSNTNTNATTSADVTSQSSKPRALFDDLDFEPLPLELEQGSNDDLEQWQPYLEDTSELLSMLDNSTLSPADGGDDVDADVEVDVNVDADVSKCTDRERTFKNSFFASSESLPKTFEGRGEAEQDEDVGEPLHAQESLAWATNGCEKSVQSPIRRRDRDSLYPIVQKTMHSYSPEDVDISIDSARIQELEQELNVLDPIESPSPVPSQKQEVKEHIARIQELERELNVLDPIELTSPSRKQGEQEKDQVRANREWFLNNAEESLKRKSSNSPVHISDFQYFSQELERRDRNGHSNQCSGQGGTTLTPVPSSASRNAFPAIAPTPLILTRSKNAPTKQISYTAIRAARRKKRRKSTEVRPRDFTS